MGSTSNPNRIPFYCGILVGYIPLVSLFIAICLFHRITSAHNDPSQPIQLFVNEPLAGDTIAQPTQLPRIDPTTPITMLLPAPPPVTKAPVYLGSDLASVPELMLEATPKATTKEWATRRAYSAAAALHLNSKEEDGFIRAVLRTRPDLAGVPFTMGEACRTQGTRAVAFKEAVMRLRVWSLPVPAALGSDPGKGDNHRQLVHLANLAVLTQITAEEETSGQQSSIHAVSAIPRLEATRELARLAVFSTEQSARTNALEALAIRREEGSTEVFLMALRYPWPAVAHNAATAIAHLKRKDLIPQLQAMLEAQDPRGPRTEVVAGRKETVVHELVRINHLHNCLLCHAPAERGMTPPETLVAEIPIPSVPIPDPSMKYGHFESTLLVRIDVTYLRQDFSAMLNATDWTAEHWPLRQRFDFLLRRRVLTSAEAADIRSRLTGVSPYRQAIERALRDLTGRNIEERVLNEKHRF